MRGRRQQMFNAMTIQGEHHLLHIGRAVGTSQKTDERPWRSQPEAAWSRWVVPASCVSNVIRAVLAPVLVLDFAPTRRGSRQSQRGGGHALSSCVFRLPKAPPSLSLPFPLQHLSFPFLLLLCAASSLPYAAGLILRTLYPSFCFLALLAAALASLDRPSLLPVVNFFLLYPTTASLHLS